MAGFGPRTYQTALDAIGNTPMIRLHKVCRDLPGNIALYAKCEQFNPTGSIKDRIAKFMIEKAEARKEIKPGGTIVEATSGNTGMGLALVAALKGYKAILVMPDKMSMEKINALKAYGAEVVVCPTNVEPEDPRSYYCVSRKIAKETPNSFYANQYYNPDNPQTHYETTGPEIWNDMGGAIDIFVCGLGTGGTVTGITRYLKEKNPQLKTWGADPIGSLYFEYFYKKTLGKAEPYLVEGIGEDFIPGTIDLKTVDEVIQVTDKESFEMTNRLVREEGLYCGGSCGSAIVAAIKQAKKWNPSKPVNIVVLLPDRGDRYLSKVFNPEWLSKNKML